VRGLGRRRSRGADVAMPDVEAGATTRAAPIPDSSAPVQDSSAPVQENAAAIPDCASPVAKGSGRPEGAGRAPMVIRATRLTAATLAATALVAAPLLAACSASGTGARDEGPARTDTVGHAAPPSPSATSASPAPAQQQGNAVKLVLGDPKVSKDVKRHLKPCRASGYPVDVSYGKLTGATTDDIVVNVMNCDSVGVGSYVYRPDGSNHYRNVFQDEEPPVYADIDRGDLVVTQKVYQEGDQLSYPSSEDVITYGWSASKGRFTERDRTHNDYSNPVGGDKPTTADN
jgi:hypothetical protein